MAKILLVEDDIGIAQLIQFTLESERFVVDHCANASEGLQSLRTNEYDLLVLDWSLPDSTGVDLCKQYRSMGGSRPVLMLTARGASQDKVTGLSAGADDYVVKPFDPDELIARAKALLRRPPVISIRFCVLRLSNSTPTTSRSGKMACLSLSCPRSSPFYNC